MSIAEQFMHLTPRFYVKTKPNPHKSAETGVPEFDKIEMCEIRIAGEKGTIHHHRANEGYHFHRENLGDMGKWFTPIDVFPEEYAAFKKNEEMVQTGTPLISSGLVDEPGAETLKALNIYTVEQLARMQDPEKLGMNGNVWIESAQSFLKKRDSTKSKGALERRIEELEAQLAAAGGTAEPGDNKSAANDQSGEQTEVTEPGPFFGYSKADLKNYIKDQTGHAPRGNPNLATLLEAAKEASKKVAA